MRSANVLALFAALLALVAAATAQNVPPKVTLRLDGASAKPGALVKGQVVVALGPNLHVYQNPPSEGYMIPIKVVAASPATTTGFKPVYPKGELKPVGGSDKPVAVHSGTFRIAVSFKAPAKPGTYDAKVTFSYQQCDEQNCFPPAKVDVMAKLRVAGAAGGVVAQVDQPSSATPAADDTREGLAGALVGALQNRNYGLLFGLLFVVGLAINLTPCVYPMIPITLSFFSNQAGESRAGRIGLGLMYMIGIAATYGLVGGVAAGVGASFGALFTQAWFNLLLAALMIGLALSMFELYQIGIPPVLARQLKGRSGPTGALIMGLLVGVAAAPCAGPAIVAVFTEVAKTQNVPFGVLIFTSIGLGIGLPYLVLASLTAGAKALPKAGGWMKTVKAILGLVVIGVGLNYLLLGLGQWVPKESVPAVWIAFYALAGLYLVFFEHGGTSRAVFGIKGATVLLLGVLVGMGYQGILAERDREELSRAGAVAAKIDWQPFSESAWQAAKASGKVILVDATADWCAECKVIEKNVLSRPETILAARDVAAIKVDWSTGVSEEYMKRTGELFNIKGLPRLVVFRPGGIEHRAFNHLKTPAELIEALEGAVGTMAASR